MLINKNENISYFDVDGTLVMHEKPNNIPPGESVQVFDAVTAQFITLQINRPMVRLVKEASHRGDHVRVWSRGGWQWAAAVVKALGLEPWVTDVETKPMVYFDDTPIEKWLPYRVFIEPSITYKQYTTNKGGIRWLLKK